MNFHLIQILLLPVFLLSCNDASLQGGKKDDKGKELNEVQPIKDLNSSDADPENEDDETRIATQPADVSGAFLTTKVIKVEGDQVYFGAAYYVERRMEEVESNQWNFERNGVQVARDQFAIMERSDQEKLQYSAIFKFNYSLFEGLVLSNGDLKESRDLTRYSENAMNAQSCGTPGGTDTLANDMNCPMVCNDNVQFFHFSSANADLKKFKIGDVEELNSNGYTTIKKDKIRVINFHKVSDCEGLDQPHHVAGSFKMDVYFNNPVKVNGATLWQHQGHLNLTDIISHCSNFTQEKNTIGKIIESWLKAVRLAETEQNLDGMPVKKSKCNYED